MDREEDDRERQIAEVTLLSTMYPSEFAWRTPPPEDPSANRSFPDPAFTLALDPSYTLEISLPSTYPSSSKPIAYLSCGGDVSTSLRKEARHALAMIVDDQAPGLEVLDLIVTSFTDVLPTLINKPTANSSSSSSSSTTASTSTNGQETNGTVNATPSTDKAKPIKRIVIWSHHLLATSKRRDIQSWSKDLCLGGFARPGYPGAVFAEGDQDQIDEFVRRLKQLRWQALQVRCEEVVEKRICGDGREGVREVEGLGEIAEKLKETDPECASMFLEGMKIATVH